MYKIFVVTQLNVKFIQQIEFLSKIISLPITTIENEKCYIFSTLQLFQKLLQITNILWRLQDYPKVYLIIDAFPVNYDQQSGVCNSGTKI